MSRSAADATRFTATAPHAHSKSGPTAPSGWQGMKVRSPQGGSAPSPGGTNQETPKQKVERLRAEARAARIARSSSPVDQFIGRGRVWADRLHKVTVISIIAASGIAGILTIYSAASLVSYNRRQKELWIDMELQKLLDAKKAYVAGNATHDQIQLLEREKAADEEKRRREELKKNTTFYKAKSWLFGGLKTDDMVEGASNGELEAGRGQSRVLEAINAQTVNSQIEPTGSIQQQSQSEKVTHTPPTNTNDSKKSWTSWLTGR